MERARRIAFPNFTFCVGTHAVDEVVFCVSRFRPWTASALFAGRAHPVDSKSGDDHAALDASRGTMHDLGFHLFGMACKSAACRYVGSSNSERPSPLQPLAEIADILGYETQGTSRQCLKELSVKYRAVNLAACN